MAIDDLLDEHEQSERVRSWLKSNALGLIGGVGLGLGAIYGWTWWQDQNAAQRLKAGDDYQAMVQSLKSGKVADAQTKRAALKDSEYAVLAALDLAKSQLDAGKRDDAIATLRAIETEDSVLRGVVDQRLARLLTDAGKAEEALKLLEKAEDAGSLEARGDALFALGRRDQAREAYRQALGKLDVGAQLRPLLELKLTQAGGKPPQADEQPKPGNPS